MCDRALGIEGLCGAKTNTDCGCGWKPGKWTEAHLIERLRRRYSVTEGNGPVWSFVSHVRNDSGFGATRTIDALAMHQWPSRNHELHAFEVKVTRSDFRRELADQDKLESWVALGVDYLWIVAPRDVVPINELPATWGLLHTWGDGLSAKRQALRRHPRPSGMLKRDPLDRGLVAAMLRQCGRQS